MVHSLAVPQTEDRAGCRLMAVGRGDGCVALYDADWKPAGSSSSSGSSGGGSKKGGKARQRGGGGGGGGSGSAARQAVVAPGRLALLGREQGGHTAAVNSVACYPDGASWRQLLSAGNDCRLLLWDLSAADEQAATAVAAAQEAGEGTAAEPGGGSLRQGGDQRPAAAAAVGEEGGSSQLLAAEVRHPRKINAARPAAVPGCPYGVFVADTGRRVTALALA